MDWEDVDNTLRTEENQLYVTTINDRDEAEYYGSMKSYQKIKVEGNIDSLKESFQNLTSKTK